MKYLCFFLNCLSRLLMKKEANLLIAISCNVKQFFKKFLDAIDTKIKLIVLLPKLNFPVKTYPASRQTNIQTVWDNI